MDKIYGNSVGEVRVASYYHHPYGDRWRISYRYRWQNHWTVYENCIAERPSEERIEDILSRL